MAAMVLVCEQCRMPGLTVKQRCMIDGPLFRRRPFYACTACWYKVVAAFGKVPV